MCNHDNKDLISISNLGIKCRKCGKIFQSFKEVDADRKADESKSENLTANSEKDGEAKEDIEKVKTEAVPTEDKPAKASRTTTKKAVSKKKKGAK